MSYITEDQFEGYLRGLQGSPRISVDTEGTLTHPFSQTWGASTSAFGVNEYFAWYHRSGTNLPLDWLPRLAKVIENHPCLIMHNAKHDLKALRNLGINFKGKFYDTMLMAHMVNENFFSKELDFLSRHFGGEPKKRSDVMKVIIDKMGWEHVPVSLMREYGSNDAFITEALFESLYPDFCEQGFDGDLWEIEQKFSRLLLKIEDNGVLIDTELSIRELERGEKIMAEIRNELGFNPSSPVDLGKFLIDELKLPMIKPTKTTKKLPRDQQKPSFDKDAMEVYDELLARRNDKRARQILIYRGWQKTTSSNYRPYLELLGPDGRLRPNFKIHGTHTGRLSCEKPNLQQIPRESPNDWNGRLKEAFITECGRRAYEFDYSQLEFRLGAAYGKVQKLIEVFNDPTQDVFQRLAEDNGLIRQDAKTLNYTLQFGGGAQRISEVFGVSHGAAKAIINKYYSEYPGLKKIATLAHARAIANGYVQYWTGRRRHFQFEEDCRKAFNSVCQGGAFEIVKRKMIELDEAGLNNDECRMELQVHDSIRFNIEDGKEATYLPEIKKIMEDIPQFGVKFKVDCKVWAHDEKLEIAA